MGGRRTQAPSIAVVVTCYNYAHFLAACLDSVLAQTLAPDEIIVVNDGSTDHSSDVLAAYDDRVQVLNTENGGQAAAFNRGFAASRADLVLFLDADDILWPEAIETILLHWRTGDGFTSFGLELVNEAGDSLGTHPLSTQPASGDMRPELLRTGTFAFPPTSGNVFARDFLDAALPMPEAPWRISADCFLIRAAALWGRKGFIPHLLGGYRLHQFNNYALGLPDAQNNGTALAGQADAANALEDLAAADFVVKEAGLPEALRLRAEALRKSETSRGLSLPAPDLFRSRYLPVMSLNKPYWKGAAWADLPSEISSSTTGMDLHVPYWAGRLNVDLEITRNHEFRDPLITVDLDGERVVRQQLNGGRIVFSLPPSPWQTSRVVHLDVTDHSPARRAPTVTSVQLRKGTAEGMYPLVPTGHWTAPSALSLGLDDAVWSLQKDGSAELHRAEGDVRLTLPKADKRVIGLQLSCEPGCWLNVTGPEGALLFTGNVSQPGQIHLPLALDFPEKGALTLQVEPGDAELRLHGLKVQTGEATNDPPMLSVGEHLSMSNQRFRDVFGFGWSHMEDAAPATTVSEASLQFVSSVDLFDCILTLHVRPSLEIGLENPHLVGISLDGEMLARAELLGEGTIAVPLGSVRAFAPCELMVHSIFSGGTVDEEPTAAPLEMFAVELAGEGAPLPPAATLNRYRPAFERLLADAETCAAAESPDRDQLSSLRDALSETVLRADRALLLACASDEGKLAVLVSLGLVCRSSPVPNALPYDVTGEDDVARLRRGLLAILWTPASVSGFGRLDTVPPPFLSAPKAFATYLGQPPLLPDGPAHADYRQYLTTLLSSVTQILAAGPSSSGSYDLAAATLVRLRPVQTLFGDGNLRDVIEQLGQAIETYLVHLGAPLRPRPALPKPRDRLRVGVMVRSLRETPEGWALVGMFGELDPDRFELCLILLDELTPTLDAPDNFETVISLRKQSVAASVQQIRDLQLDVFLMGCFVFGWEKTSAIVAHRLAPVQVWQAAVCPATSGMSSFDAVLTCREWETDDAQSQYSEEIIWLDGVDKWAFAFTPTEGNWWVNTRKKLWVAEDKVVLVSGAMAHKIQDDLLEAWAKILANAPDIVLVLYPYAANWSMPFTEEVFTARLEAAGLPKDRVIVLPSMSHQMVGDVLDAADLYLDSFPYTGATTVCEAMSRGVPVVTLAGKALRQLTGAAWVRAYGLDELVATTPDEYIQIATELAHDVDRRKALSKICRRSTAMDPPAHNDSAAFARALDGALTHLAETRLGWSPAELQSPPILGTAKQKFVVLASPRSGSTLLCTMLNRAPGVVCHFELFHNEYIQFYGEPDMSPEKLFARDADTLTFLDETFEQFSDAADVQGFKLFAHHPLEVQNRIFQDPDFKLIYLSRQNRLAQFSSYEIAVATDNWIKNTPGLDKKAPKLDWDQAAFEAYEADWNRVEREWRARFVDRDLPPLQLDYEELLTDQTRRSLNDYLGISIPAEAAVSTKVYRQNPTTILDRFNDPENVAEYLAGRGLSHWAGTT
ncbi:MAG: Stf0 family sulfotransferase [Pseudomonadota bacterium]